MTIHESHQPPSASRPSHEAIDKTMEQLFPEENGPSAQRLAVAAGLATAGAVTVGYSARRFGIDLDGVFDKKFTPEPQVFPQIVDGMVAVNEGIRTTGPYVMLASMGYATQRAVRRWTGHMSGASSTLGDLSSVEYSGTDTLVDGDANAGKGEEGKSGRLSSVKNKAFYPGLMVTAAAVSITGGSSGLEHEISNGPLRPVGLLFDTLAQGAGEGDERFIIVQDESTTFMDDSHIPADATAEVALEAAKEGISIVPFGKELPRMDGESGLVLTLPDELFEELTGVQLDGTCNEKLIITDESSNKDELDEVTVNGQKFLVAGEVYDSAQMNRAIGISSMEDGGCVVDPGDVDRSPSLFGAVISGTSQGEIEPLMEGTDLENFASVITEKRFEDNNRDFWRKNGTPLLLQLMGYVSGLAMTAIGSERWGALRRNLKELGALKAMGVGVDDMRKIERLRALRETGMATAMSVVPMAGMATLFNAAEFGLKIGIGAREAAVGFSLTLGAKVWGSRRAVNRFSKKLNLASAIR